MSIRDITRDASTRPRGLSWPCGSQSTSEFEHLEQLLAKAPALLNPGGRMGVISFHSGEDRLIKVSFQQGKQQSYYEILTRKPITANRGPDSAEPPVAAAPSCVWPEGSDDTDNDGADVVEAVDRDEQRDEGWTAGRTELHRAVRRDPEQSGARYRRPGRKAHGRPRHPPPRRPDRPHDREYDPGPRTR